MFRFAEDLRVYLHRDPIDFRCGINRLAILVEQSMGLNPFERAALPHASAPSSWADSTSE
ncbi:IS66 family insertion sequence element accessory protein TnpB [Novosphingobium sp. fls2-241-R2A-195]|uniref:IS66 family insertion sequence element accessory protein TnpB n=1 Tax=Novosphingobium sp. fls2-241-R2A-195 TaxID=3040296 RepID=UPI0033062C8A